MRYTWSKSKDRPDQWLFMGSKGRKGPVVELTRTGDGTRLGSDWRARYLCPSSGPLDDIRTAALVVPFAAVMELRRMSARATDERGRRICGLALDRLGQKFGMGQGDEVGE